MSLELDRIVSVGRCLAEYRAMFGLSEADLDRRVLGVADGPASFNAEMHAQGKRVVSLDPIYDLPLAEIARECSFAIDSITGQMAAHPERWRWVWHASPTALREHRLGVLERFCADYALGRAEGRYRVGALPATGLPDGAFDLALCSHFLLLYADRLSFDFHVASLRELLRVACEVRIYPTLALDSRLSPVLDRLVEAARSEGFEVAVKPSAYQLQGGESGMLVVRRPA